MRLSSLLSVTSALISLALAESISIIHDPSLALEDYSSYWSALSDANFSISFLPITDPSLPSFISPPDEPPSFDHLILFCPTTKTLPPSLSPQRLFQFLTLQKNIIFILTPSLTATFSDLAREFSIDFDSPQTSIIDHFHSHPSSPTPDLLILPPPSPSYHPFISSTTSAGPPILYRGIAHQTGDSPLVTTVLKARETAYSYDLDSTADVPSEDSVYVTGTNAGLVSAFQATNDARVLWVGSADLFSNQFGEMEVTDPKTGVKYPHSGNLNFLKDITLWTFHRTGIVELSTPVLTLQSTKSVPKQFRVGDKVELNLEISELTRSGPTPFTPTSPIQFSFSLLDPYLLLPLSTLPSTTSSTPLHSSFTLPGHQGVFTLLVSHNRPGWNQLSQKLVVSVTPLRHDEYPRWIVGAWPWYVGAGSVSVGFVGVVVGWLML